MERDGMRMARAKTTALTKRIDDMLDSWEEYAREKAEIWACVPCLDDRHYDCRDERCQCEECEYAEEVIVHASR